MTKEDYDYHVQQTYEALAECPLHAAYFKKWFDKPKSIAKYEIMKVMGSLCTISSSNSESLNSSNESFMPTVTMGIMTPEIHMHELTKRNNEWVRRDLSQKGKYRLLHSSHGKNMPDDSIQKKLSTLLVNLAIKTGSIKRIIVCLITLQKQSTK